MLIQVKMYIRYVWNVLVPIYASRAVKEDLLTNRKTTRRQSRAECRSENMEGGASIYRRLFEKIGSAPVIAKIWEGAYVPLFRRPCKVAQGKRKKSVFDCQTDRCVKLLASLDYYVLQSGGNYRTYIPGSLIPDQIEKEPKYQNSLLRILTFHWSAI